MENEIRLNIDSYQVSEIISSVINAIQNNKIVDNNINIGYLPPINVNLSGIVTNENRNIEEKVITDKRSDIDKTTSMIETLKDSITSSDAKAALEGGYSVLNGTLEEAYILLKRQIKLKSDEVARELKQKGVYEKDTVQ